MFSLSSADTTLDVNPEVGGAVWAMRCNGVDVLRPAEDGTLDALMTSSFPLVPFCNRIKDGEFVFHGKRVKLSPNLPGHPHTLHGQGWRKPWIVAEKSPSRTVLRFDHAADEWPWAYQALVTYELRRAGLRCFLSVKNLSKVAMPAGLGFHPYFKRTPKTRLKARVDGVWINTDDNLPRNRHAGVLRKDWTRGDVVAHETTIDNCYTGFGGKAEIFEDARLTHTLRASPDCHWLHVFAPVEHDFFCAEPVNHMPDPFNHANSGLRSLKPDETALVWMDIQFHP